VNDPDLLVGTHQDILANACVDPVSGRETSAGRVLCAAGLMRGYDVPVERAEAVSGSDGAWCRCLLAMTLLAVNDAHCCGPKP